MSQKKLTKVADVFIGTPYISKYFLTSSGVMGGGIIVRSIRSGSITTLSVFILGFSLNLRISIWNNCWKINWPKIYCELINCVIQLVENSKVAWPSFNINLQPQLLIYVQGVSKFNQVFLHNICVYEVILVDLMHLIWTPCINDLTFSTEWLHKF